MQALVLLVLCAHVATSRHVSAPHIATLNVHTHSNNEGNIKLATLIDKLMADTSAAFEEQACADYKGCLECLDLNQGCEFNWNSELSIFFMNSFVGLSLVDFARLSNMTLL
jgi:hypothetical protein